MTLIFSTLIAPEQTPESPPVDSSRSPNQSGMDRLLSWSDCCTTPRYSNSPSLHMHIIIRIPAATGMKKKNTLKNFADGFILQKGGTIIIVINSSWLSWLRADVWLEREGQRNTIEQWCQISTFTRSALYFGDNGMKKGVKGVIPGNFVAAGHGEQSFTLKNPVPSLDSVTGANWDGAFPWLDFCAELSPGLSVRVSVSLIWEVRKQWRSLSEGWVRCVIDSSSLMGSPSTPASWGEKMRASPQGEVLMYRWNWTFSFNLKPCLFSHLLKMDFWCSSAWLLQTQT